MFFTGKWFIRMDFAIFRLNSRHRCIIHQSKTMEAFVSVEKKKRIYTIIAVHLVGLDVLGEKWTPNLSIVTSKMNSIEKISMHFIFIYSFTSNNRVTGGPKYWKPCCTSHSATDFEESSRILRNSTQTYGRARSTHNDLSWDEQLENTFHLCFEHVFTIQTLYIHI